MFAVKHRKEQRRRFNEFYISPCVKWMTGCFTHTPTHLYMYSICVTMQSEASLFFNAILPQSFYSPLRQGNCTVCSYRTKMQEAIHYLEELYFCVLKWILFENLLQTVHLEEFARFVALEEDNKFNLRVRSPAETGGRPTLNTKWWNFWKGKKTDCWMKCNLCNNKSRTF